MKRLVICTVLIMLFGLELFAQESSDREAIAETVQLYFEGMMERNREKLDLAFLPEARLIGYRGKDLSITSFEAWATTTSKGEPRNPNLYKNELVNIRVQGNAAVAEAELYWPGIYYYDFLTLVKLGETWKIVNKSWFEKKL